MLWNHPPRPPPAAGTKRNHLSRDYRGYGVLWNHPPATCGRDKTKTFIKGLLWIRGGAGGNYSVGPQLRLTASPLILVKILTTGPHKKNRYKCTNFTIFNIFKPFLPIKIHLHPPHFYLQPPLHNLLVPLTPHTFALLLLNLIKL